MDAVELRRTIVLQILQATWDWSAMAKDDEERGLVIVRLDKALERYVRNVTNTMPND